jgi:hypothetical protein
MHILTLMMIEDAGNTMLAITLTRIIVQDFTCMELEHHQV